SIHGTSLMVFVMALLLCGSGSFFLLRGSSWLRAATSQLTAAALPSYQLELHRDAHVGAEASIHSNSDKLIELSMEPTPSVALRPAQRVRGGVSARSFLLRNGQVRSWQVRLLSLASGTFLVRAPVAELPELLPGTTELIFVIGRPEALLAHPLAARLASEQR